MKHTAILFVCMGNICRSPLAEGILRNLADSAALHQLTVDSAGTGGWHRGDAPDPRSVAMARRHG
ncbi:MAG: low molecular weight phosphotyrosine protein phosphatase, partial [Rhizobium pusense]|nr:low molecular weight phosphotyrosine protein phosphatase [Agrobacterium pusense]